jgi:hypothetical protein
MKYLESYKVFEKSIGVQNIYKKHYSDIKHELFLQLLDLDPTSNTHYLKSGKMGKYSKWILREYRKGHFDSYVKDDDIKSLKFLREELKLVGTSWLKKRMGKTIDVLKYSYPDLTNLLSSYLDQYRKETIFDDKDVDIEYDLLFEADKWMIFVPLNWQTSQYLCGKDSQWCSNTQSGWVYTKGEGNILYRFIPKGYGSKMRLTWMNDKSKYNWAFAYTKSVYHLRGDGNPFENDYIGDIGGKNLATLSPSEIKELSGKDIHNELVMQISNIHPDAKKEVINYHKKVKLMDHQL